MKTGCGASMAVSKPIGLAKGPRMCISSRFTAAATVVTTLREYQ